MRVEGQVVKNYKGQGASVCDEGRAIRSEGSRQMGEGQEARGWE